MVISQSTVTSNFSRFFKQEVINSSQLVENSSKTSFSKSLNKQELTEEISLEKSILIKKDEQYKKIDDTERVVNTQKRVFENNMNNNDSGGSLTTKNINIFRTSEKIDLQTKAAIKTADGREINLNFALNFKSDFNNERRSESNIHDPLVINFDAPLATVTNKRVKFDLNSDGVDDLMTNVKSGSGFLAYDKDRDGVINNGSELFGTESGNGFQDLKKFDRDNNGWIDENDIIYEGLKILTFNSEGKQELKSLKEANIGAMYLGESAIKFSQKSINGSILGQTTATSFYLKENGDLGTTQQLNLNVMYGIDFSKHGLKPFSYDPTKSIQSFFQNPMDLRTRKNETIIEESTTVQQEEKKTVTQTYTKEDTSITVKTEDSVEKEKGIDLTGFSEDKLKQSILDMEDKNLETILNMDNKE